MQKIGVYQLIESLYSGPRPLYKAKAPDGRVLALKTAPVSSLTPEMRERFNREAETCSTLDHPNVIRVHDFGEADGVLYQAMDLLEGADLSKIFGSGRQFAWEHKLSIMEQVCDGLQYAHSRGLVHRDVKPANIFIEYAGRVRILDFGMARVDASTLTIAGSAVGTLNYMAPEQVRGETCTFASDIFSAGIVFYQLAGGRHPFSAKYSNVGQIMNGILFDMPPPLVESAPDAPEGLEFILSKALEKDPNRRLQTAADLKQALSLCRVTLKMRAQAGGGSPLSGATPVVRDGPKDEDKTVAIRAQGIPPGPPRGAPSGVSIPPPPSPVPPPPVSTVSKPPASQNAVYCPSCTHANPPGALFCQRCGQPLAARTTVVQNQGMGGTWAVAVIVSGVVLLIVIFALIWWSGSL